MEKKKLLLFFCFLFAIISTKAESSTEKTLKNRILTNYDKSIRPSEPVDIYLRLIFKQIANVDEMNQIITSSSLKF